MSNEGKTTPAKAAKIKLTTIAFAFVGGVAISGAKLVLPTLRSVYYGYAHHMQKVLDFIEGVATNSKKGSVPNISYLLLLPLYFFIFLITIFFIQYPKHPNSYK
jgi:hypothetical protein